MKIYFDILGPKILHIIYVLQILSNLHLFAKFVNLAYNSLYYDETKGFTYISHSIIYICFVEYQTILINCEIKLWVLNLNFTLYHYQNCLLSKCYVFLSILL